MGLFERYKAHRGQNRVEPGLQPGDTGSHEIPFASNQEADHETPATESFEAATERYFERLSALGIPSPDDWRNPKKKPATTADVARMYEVNPSFVDLLPWVDYLPEEKAMLLEDGVSRAAFFELTPIGTEGRDPAWLRKARDALENALQDSFDELETSPWVVQLYAQDETSWDDYLQQLHNYIHPRARGSAFTELYLKLMKQHLEAISKPGGLFEDTKVSQLPWRGQQRRVRLVVYRRTKGNNADVRGQAPGPYLKVICDRLVGGLANAGIRTKRMDGHAIRHWLIHWFNPRPDHLGPSDADIRRFYETVCKEAPATEEGELPLASGTDFSQNLCYREPLSDTDTGLWYFDGLPHRVVMLDRLREPPKTGHITGETRKGGDALNALFDKMPEDTILCITLIITPQDTLESHLENLARKAVGDTQASSLTREDVKTAREFLGRKHKLYRGSVAFYLRGQDHAQLQERSLQLANALLGAGMEPVDPINEVAPLNSYLRWLPGNFDPNERRALQWYTQLMFAQHIANLAPVWGRSTGTGHPGLTFFNRGGAPLTFDPLNKLDRQMNAHLFVFGPTGSGKSASLNNLINQLIAIYRPRLFIVEAGNSFGLTGEFAQRLGLTVNRIKLSPGSGVSLAPFADAARLVQAPDQIKVLDADDVDSSDAHTTSQDGSQEDDQRDILGELEIAARLMITGGEEKEEARLTRADRSAIRHCILAAAKTCVAAERTVLTQDIRDALQAAGMTEGMPEARRNRMLEMAEAMEMFCMGADGEIFNREGTPWPEADITIVDLATYAREGYNAQLSIAYISLLNTVNNIAERDQYKGRPIVKLTDEGHIITKNPLLSPYAVKITKMWRKLGAWFWLATQNVDDLPPAAAPMLNMIEWWICLNMPPDEVEKIAKFRELSPSQKALMLSARKESGKYTEGVILSKSMEVLFRAVPPSLYLALAMTEPEEKKQRYDVMQELGVDELGAAIKIAADLDRLRGIEPHIITFPEQTMALESLA
ncbi:conjugative transfer ATPase [Pseudomonas gingeri]|uniref:Conjugative transfer ATPase n=1 Tax=Pseudomonas gingeri TaxID=117681 RepID=A0A7Y8BZX9_9PSED|nr:conjugative transfer ATPase [Pseudomonas gingeri]NWB94815.1 conjugative transfer ATPase [Pseudomonas gingeri]